MNTRFFAVFLFLFFAFFSICISQANNSFKNDFLTALLRENPKRFAELVKKEKEYEIQIIYTQINRDEKNEPSFTEFQYQADESRYFYPASLVKLPCAALALEKLNNLNIVGLDKYSKMQTDSAWKCQQVIKIDSSASNLTPSVANYIKRMLLVSDNESYNRIYEFLGQEYINKKLTEKGYVNARIVHRFDAACHGQENSYTNPISFFDLENNLLYQQAAQHNLVKYNHPLGIVKKGAAYVDGRGKYVYEPKDFTYSNYLSLQDAHCILMSIIFPAATSKSRRFNLSDDDLQFLYKYLSMYPSESTSPRYNEKEFHSCYKKYLFYGAHKMAIPKDSIRIFNIVGQSFGYLSDCAYFCDFENKIEFFLSASIYVNSNGVLNDGKYEYEDVGFPFLENLGKTIYELELKRKKEFVPNLVNFNFEYGF